MYRANFQSDIPLACIALVFHPSLHASGSGAFCGRIKTAPTVFPFLRAEGKAVATKEIGVNGN